MNLDTLKTSPVIHRHPDNPVLSPKDVPYHSTLVFNPGVVKYQGRYVMVFRNDMNDDPNNPNRISRSDLGLAFSDNGIHWDVQPEPCFAMETDEIIKAYDPRLTVIDGRVYMCFAVDTKHGLRGGIAVTDDFKNFEVLSLTAPDNRNLVLFPEKINGDFVRLERPLTAYFTPQPEYFHIWCSRSPDAKYWGDTKLVLGCDQVAFANRKIGPGAPPVRTKHGWLTLFHAADYADSRNWGWAGTWQKRYTTGIMLLDLEDPSKIVGRCPDPLIVPEPQYEYEAKGFRDFVTFPCGMILEDSGEVKIYYGAADTVIALATADVNDLVRLCL